MAANFPNLELADWRATRDALHDCARVIGGIRREMTPPAKHWWHITLAVSARGLTTTPIPAPGQTFELTIDPLKGQVEVATSEGREAIVALRGKSQQSLYGDIAEALATMGIEAAATGELDDAAHDYDPSAAARFWRALTQIDAIYKEFKGGLREETGPVHVFPHHFDLSLNWFSGRLVPGEDPADAENADEQMNFGFVTGDDTIPEAYFYVTAYPEPAQLTEAALPEGAFWQTEGFTGAILMYETLARSSEPHAALLEFLRAAHRAGSSLMK